MKKRIFLITIAVLVGLVVFRLFINNQMASYQMKMMAGGMIASVEAEYPKQVEITDSSNVSGNVDAKERVDIVPRLNGYLNKKYFHDGDSVKKGQPLFLIEPDQYQIATNSARASLEMAEAECADRQKNLKRVSELLSKDFVSRADYDSSAASYDVAKSRVDAARQAVSEAKLNLSYSKIKSPITGKISDTKIKPGNYVTPLSGPLATIVSLDPIAITFNLDSKDYIKIKKEKGNIFDQKVSIILPDESEYEYQGNIDFCNNTIDNSTGTVKVRASVKNPDNLLLPGQYVNVRISSQSRKVLTVPSEALLQNDKGKFVYIYDEEKKIAVVRPIKTEKLVEQGWIVTEGLNGTERVIYKGIQNLYPNAKVELIDKKIEG